MVKVLCLACRAEQELAAIRKRRDAFPELRCDADWWVVLDLLMRRRERPVSVSDACIATGVAATTALRRIEQLESAGVLIRTPDPRDGRRWFVRLSGEAEKRLTSYLRSCSNHCRQ